jgi:hypothetical protein
VFHTTEFRHDPAGHVPVPVLNHQSASVARR